MHDGELTYMGGQWGLEVGFLLMPSPRMEAGGRYSQHSRFPRR